MELRLVSPPRWYTVVPQVLAGEYPGAGRDAETRARLQRLLGDGVDAFLDLTEDGELEPYAHLLPPRVRHERHPLRRGAVPAPEHMRRIVDAVERLAAGGWFVYVHDAEGIGRVGAVIGCWLAEREVVPRDPLATLAELRSTLAGRVRSPDDRAQRAFVRGWSRGLWAADRPTRGAPAAALVPVLQAGVSEGGMR